MVFWQNKQKYLDIVNGKETAKVVCVVNVTKSGKVAYLMNSNELGEKNKKLVYSDDAILGWVPIRKTSDIDQAYKLTFIPKGDT